MGLTYVGFFCLGKYIKAKRVNKYNNLHLSASCIISYKILIGWWYFFVILFFRLCRIFDYCMASSKWLFVCCCFSTWHAIQSICSSKAGKRRLVRQLELQFHIRKLGQVLPCDRPICVHPWHG